MAQGRQVVALTGLQLVAAQAFHAHQRAGAGGHGAAGLQQRVAVTLEQQGRHRGGAVGQCCTLGAVQPGHASVASRGAQRLPEGAAAVVVLRQHHVAGVAAGQRGGHLGHQAQRRARQGPHRAARQQAVAVGFARGAGQQQAGAQARGVQRRLAGRVGAGLFGCGQRQRGLAQAAQQLLRRVLRQAGRGWQQGQCGVGRAMYQAVQVQRPARLGAGARQAHAAEGLHAHHGADDVAVDVEVAGVDALAQVLDGFVNAAVHAKRQAVARGIDAVEQRVELLAWVANDVQNRAENLAGQARGAINFDDGGGDEVAVECAVRAFHARHFLAGVGHAGDVGLDLRTRLGVDHRAHVGVQAVGVAQRPFLQRVAQHGQGAVGHVVLQAQQAQGRAALARRVEGRGQHVGHHLFGQGRRIDHHGVLAAGLGHQGNGLAGGRQAGAELPCDQARHFGGAGEHHAGHLRVRHQGCAHALALAGHQLQRIARHAGFVQEGDHGGGRERCLLGGLGQHGVAGGQGGGHLAAEDGEREVPRTDGQHHAQRALRGVVELRGHLGAVVAQEVHGLADFGHSVGQSLAGLAHDQTHQRLAALLQQVGGTLQRVGTRSGRRASPDRRGLGGALAGSLHVVRRGLVHPAHGVAELGRVAQRLPAGGACRVGGQWHAGGRRQVGLAGAVEQCGGERGELLFMCQVQAV